MGNEGDGGSILVRETILIHVTIHRIVVFLKMYISLFGLHLVLVAPRGTFHPSWHVGSLAATCGLLFAACGSSSTRD